MTERSKIFYTTNLIQQEILRRHNTLRLTCGYAEDTARIMNGWWYETKEESPDWGSCYNLAVIRIEKSLRGQIIDITSPDFLAGEVRNVFNIQQTAEEIGQKFGIPNWKLVKSFYQKGKILIPHKISF